MNKGVATIIVLVLLAGAVFLIYNKWKQLHPTIEQLPPPMPGMMVPGQGLPTDGMPAQGTPAE